MKRLLLLTLLVLVLGFGIAPALTTQAQSSVVWNAQYYNNNALIEPPVLTRQETSISYNWGSGSPASGVIPDNFSARWQASVYFSAGTYRFSILADDGARLTIDNTNVAIDTFSTTQPGNTITADVTLTEGYHLLKVEYREFGGDAYIFTDWQLISGTQNPAPSSGDWIGQYYNNRFLAGAPSAIFNENSPSHNWGSGAPVSTVGVDNFSARWSTNLSLNGTYRVQVTADDGVRVWVNGTLLIDEWHDASAQTYTKDFTLPNGTYAVAVEYYENSGVAHIDFNLFPVTDNSSGGSSSPNQPVTGSWSAQYYANPELNGQPLVTRVESSPTNNWGVGSPSPSIPADDFSARWSTNVQLNGTYQLSVQADDGVRVWVNGVNVIDEWHLATGQTYTDVFSLPQGTYLIVIEYYEHTENAYMTFNLSPGGETTPGSQPQPTGATATVTAARLNVRSAPNATTASVLAKINRGEIYPIVGRNADSSWWQIQVDNSTYGWVFFPYVDVLNSGNVPQTSNSGQLANKNVTGATGYTLTTRFTLNIRSGPGRRYALLNRIPQGQTAQIIARNSGNSWWLIEYNGIVGWISGAYVTLAGNINYSEVPLR